MGSPMPDFGNTLLSSRGTVLHSAAAFLVADITKCAHPQVCHGLCQLTLLLLQLCMGICHPAVHGFLGLAHSLLVLCSLGLQGVVLLRQPKLQGLLQIEQLSLHA